MYETSSTLVSVLRGLSTGSLTRCDHGPPGLVRAWVQGRRRRGDRAREGAVVGWVRALAVGGETALVSGCVSTRSVVLMWSHWTGTRRFRSDGFVVAPINIRQGPEVALDMINMCVSSILFFDSC